MLFQLGLDAVSFGCICCFILGSMLFRLGLDAVSIGARCCFNWG